VAIVIRRLKPLTIEQRKKLKRQNRISRRRERREEWAELVASGALVKPGAAVDAYYPPPRSIERQLMAQSKPAGVPLASLIRPVRRRSPSMKFVSARPSVPACRPREHRGSSRRCQSRGDPDRPPSGADDGADPPEHDDVARRGRR